MCDMLNMDALYRAHKARGQPPPMLEIIAGYMHGLKDGVSSALPESDAPASSLPASSVVVPRAGPQQRAAQAQAPRGDSAWGQRVGGDRAAPRAEQALEVLEVEVDEDSGPARGSSLSSRPAAAVASRGVGSGPAPPSQPLSAQVQGALRLLMFGRPSRFDESYHQGLYFKRQGKSVPYGLWQEKGGPCGVIAAVQAHVLVELMAGALPEPPHPRSATDAQCRAALVRAVARILWRCGAGRRATLVLPSSATSSSLESLVAFEFDSQDRLVHYLQAQLDHLVRPAGVGVILMIYSAVLSRGLSALPGDCDTQDATMIAKHGYCAQELVNLLLTGRASSNVFDGKKHLSGSPGEAGLTLGGIESRSEVGFLSLSDHYRDLIVGDNVKHPIYPVWVIQSESHYSTLFATDKRAAQRTPAAGPVDLFYYDSLAKQDEEIRLTIDASRGPPAAPGPKDLVPPIDQVIRTRWQGVQVDWNGTEPFL